MSAEDAGALGASLQRYDIPWRGEIAYTDQLVLGVATTPVVAVYPDDRVYSSAMASAFCTFLDSILSRYPTVRNVMVRRPPTPTY